MALQCHLLLQRKTGTYCGQNFCFVCIHFSHQLGFKISMMASMLSITDSIICYQLSRVYGCVTNDTKLSSIYSRNHC
jgi:hypothetical protein